MPGKFEAGRNGRRRPQRRRRRRLNPNFVLTCLILLAAVLFIQIMAAVCFDRDGIRRPNAPKFDFKFKK